MRGDVDEVVVAAAEGKVLASHETAEFAGEIAQRIISQLSSIERDNTAVCTSYTARLGRRRLNGHYASAVLVVIYDTANKHTRGARGLPPAVYRFIIRGSTDARIRDRGRRFHWQ
jgi:hypothetical protein